MYKFHRRTSPQMTGSAAGLEYGLIHRAQVSGAKPLKKPTCAAICDHRNFKSKYFSTPKYGIRATDGAFPGPNGRDGVITERRQKLVKSLTVKHRHFHPLAPFRL